MKRKGEDDTGFLLVRSVELCAGRTALEDSLAASSQAQNCHSRLARLVSSLSRRLLPRSASPDAEIDPDMQELLMLVLSSGSFQGDRTLQAFISVARSIYYVAICSPAAFQRHIDEVLFQDVL